jgi:hypothetical protein
MSQRREIHECAAEIVANGGRSLAGTNRRELTAQTLPSIPNNAAQAHTGRRLDGYELSGSSPPARSSANAGCRATRSGGVRCSSTTGMTMY